MIRALALGCLLLGACAPGLDSSVPRAYLRPATPVAAGTMGGGGLVEAWHLVAGRLHAGRPLCDSRDCLRLALLREIRSAAGRGLAGGVLGAELAPLAADSQVVELAEELDFALIPGAELAPEGLPALAVLGSAQLLRATAASPRERLDILAEASDQLGAGLVLRHPCAGGAQAQALLDAPWLPAALIAVEIDGPARVDAACARQRWHSWLRQGRGLVGLAAGAPLAGVERFPSRHLNLVRAPDRSADSLLRGMLAGRVQIVQAARTRPRMHLGVDLDDDGRMDEARQGDRLVLAEDSVDVQFRAVGARGSVVLLYTEQAAAAVERHEVAGNDEVFAYRYPLPSSGSGFIRAELYRDGDLLVITNPLLVSRAQPRAPGS